MKLCEIAGDLNYFGFHLDQTEEREDDNSKIWHTLTSPSGQSVTLDHSPYEYIDTDTFRRYVLFFKQHGHIPTRRDINSIGPLHSEDVRKLTR